MEEVSQTQEAKVEEKKDNRIVVVGTKAWNSTYKGISSLHERVKDIHIVEPTGKVTGKLAGAIAKPFITFAKAVKDGYKS